MQSTPGIGSVFTLYFPVDETACAAPPPIIAKPVAVHGRGRRVMYVDDDEALVFLVDRALTRKGYAVSTFTDPRLAVAALRERPEYYDLLVTDYNMPGYSGLELLRSRWRRAMSLRKLSKAH